MLWWLSYLGFNAASNLSSGLFQGSGEAQFGGWPAVLECVLGVTATVMVIVVTRSIHRLQQDKARRSESEKSVSARPASSPEFLLSRFH